MWYLEKIAQIIAALVLVSVPVSQAKSQEGPDPQSRRINMGVGKSVVLDLPRDASEIFVANPKVTNAIVRSPRRIYIVGMENGQSNVFALDASGRQIASFDISIGRDIGELDSILRTAIPKSSITLRTINDTIIMTGSVDNARDAQQANDIASGFVSGGNGSSGKIVNSLTVRGQDQVMVKVTIAEVRRDVVKQLGVSNISASGNWGLLNLTNAFGVHGAPANALLMNKGDASATLQALERYGVARILAEPAVTAVSGESAKFTAGGEMPVPSGQNCTIDPATNRNVCSASVTFRPYGVTLNFTPVVMTEGRILLRVATDVTEVDPTQSFNYGTSAVYGFLTRKNETTVELPSGGSIASAGLIQVRSKQVLNGLPGLMNLPVLGSIFRSRDYQREESELMIVITPVIARPTMPGDLKKPTDNYVDSTDPQAVFMGRVNQAYGTDTRLGQIKGRAGFIND